MNVTQATSRTLVLLLGAALVGPGMASAQQARFNARDFDRYVQEAVSDWEVPGLAVAVVRGDELLFEKGYGVLELGEERATDAHTLFAIGSTTKAMTAASIAMLADEGKLKLDDRVTDHLPWFRLKDPYVTREVRVRDLLTHNAGLGNADFLWYEQDRSTQDIVRALRWVEPAYSFRDGFIYQNIMYATAGEVIEAVSGLSWGEFIRRRILEPLEMDATVTTLAETTSLENVGRPHYRIDGTIEVIENASVDPVAAAGSIWSSVHDMSKWLRFLLAGGVTPDGERLLSEAAYAELFEPRSFVGLDSFYPTARLTKPRWRTYGLGWFQADYEGRAVDFHTGSIDGMVAIAGLIRDEGIGVYVLGNLDHAEVRHALMYRVFDLFDPDEPRDWSTDLKAMYDDLASQGQAAATTAREARVEDTRPSLPLGQYAGTYADPLFGTVEVELANGKLSVAYGHQQARLEHWHFDTFEGAWEARWRGRPRWQFEVGPQGTIDAVRMGAARFTRH